MTNLDGWQRSRRTPAIAYAVLRKFSDDRANQFVIELGWYGFIAIYPAMLAAITILSLVGAPSLGRGLVATLHSFPIVGAEFNPERSSASLHGSPVALVVGLLGLIYGAQGVTMTAQGAMAQVWNIPAVDLPKLPWRLARSLLGLITIGGCFVVNAPLATLATRSGAPRWAETLVVVAMIVVNTIFYWVAFVVLTPIKADPRRFLAGSVLGSVGFTVLITLAVGLIEHQLRHSTETYGQFGVVIGLVGFLFLLAKLSLYGGELNSVLADRLWPRALPGAEPTSADDRVLRKVAQQEVRRKDQRIRVTFGDHARDPAPTGSARKENAAERSPSAGGTGASRNGG